MLPPLQKSTERNVGNRRRVILGLTGEKIKLCTASDGQKKRPNTKKGGNPLGANRRGSRLQHLGKGGSKPGHGQKFKG